MNTTKLAGKLVKSMDFNYIESGANAVAKSFSEANQTIFTGINNKQVKVTIGEILDMLAEKASNNFDENMTIREVWEASKKKELHFSDNAVSQFYQKVGLGAAFVNRCSPELKTMVLDEFTSNYDREKAGKSLVRLQRAGYNGNPTPRVRAILSTDYCKVDNLPVMSALFRDRSQVVCVRSFINDDKFMRLELICPEMAFELDEPNGKKSLYYPIISVMNSETGNSVLCFITGLLRGVCANGLTIRVAEFVQNIRHIYQDVSALMARLASVDINLLADKNNKIIDMYKNSMGIYVPNMTEEIYNTMGAEIDEDGELKFKYPQKLVESAVRYGGTEYNSDNPTYWHVINSITRGLNTTYSGIKQTGSLMDYEEGFVPVFARRMKALSENR